ncbi:MAG: DUF72 domain-containing protein [Janthinobacterium lividum]
MIETVHCADGYAALAVRIGCAGWGLSSRVAASFPTVGSHLERYARVFSSVEINSSFYRPHQSKTYARWAASVPDAFRFSVKIPRAVTHELKLRAADAVLGAFLEQISPLGEKLGCLLLQLPPSLAFDASQAREFFSMLGTRTNTSVVCEPRHVSWFTPAAADVMRDAGISCVRAHPLPVPDIEPVGDPRSLYIRLHGAPEIYYSAYDDAFIEALAERISAARRLDTQVWCIFDNTARGEAVPNALTLIERLAAMACR